MFFHVGKGGRWGEGLEVLEVLEVLGLVETTGTRGSEREKKREKDLLCRVEAGKANPHDCTKTCCGKRDGGA